MKNFHHQQKRYKMRTQLTKITLAASIALAITFTFSCAGPGQSYYESGKEHYRNDSYGRAIEEYNMAIKLEPYNREYLYGRAEAYYMNSNYEKAIADFNVLINDRFIDDGCVYMFRGDSYRHMGYYDLAIADYEACIRHSSSYPNITKTCHESRIKFIEEKKKHGDKK
jgi:tetratricopeptide (TPR) repeat protein